jgi:hypothetical protein
MTNPNDAEFRRHGGLPADAMSFLSNSPSKGAAETEIAKQAVHAPEGLTKREYFAAMAMQGLISNLSKYVQVHQKSSAHELIYPTMDTAVIIADALIAELNK